MNQPGPRLDASLRLVRGAVLAAVVLVAGAVAHLSAGGLIPGVGWFVALGLVLVWAGAKFLARPASTGRVIALVIGGQSAVHIALTALAGHRGDGVSGPRIVGAHTAHLIAQPDPEVWTRTHRVGSLGDQLMAGRPDIPAGTFTIPVWVLHLWADLQPSQLPMFLAHAAAAAVVGWWLAQGERAIFALAALAAEPIAGLFAALGRLGRPIGTPPWRAAPTPAAVLHGRGARMLRTDLIRRGPPLPFAA